MKSLYKMLISFMLLGMAVPMLGQKNLEKWVDKCEKMKSVDITVIKKRNPDTGKWEKDLMTIRFSNNEELYDELVDACAKDEEGAYDVIKTRKDGRNIPQIYSFKTGKLKTKYLFNRSAAGSVMVTVIKEDFDE